MASAWGEALGATDMGVVFRSYHDPDELPRPRRPAWWRRRRPGAVWRVLAVLIATLFGGVIGFACAVLL